MSATVPPASPARPELRPGAARRARCAAATGARRRSSSSLLFAVYAAGHRAPRGARLRPAAERGARPADEPSRSSTTGGFDVSDEYRDRAWRSFYTGDLTPNADTRQRAAARAAGHRVPGAGRARVRDRRAARASSCSWPRSRRSGFAIAAALGRRLVPDPWATGSALAVGLSPPAVLAATTISPAMTCATLIAGGGAAGAARARRPERRPGGRRARCCWRRSSGSPRSRRSRAAVVAVALFRWLRRRRRAWTGIAAIEIVLMSVVVYISVNGRLYGGLTPYSARDRDGAADRDRRRRRPRGPAAARWRPSGSDPAFGLLALRAVPRRSASRRCGCSGARGASGCRARSPARRTSRSPPGSSARSAPPRCSRRSCCCPRSTAASRARPLAVALPCAAALCAWALRRWARVGDRARAGRDRAHGWMLVAARTDDGAARLAADAAPCPWIVLRRRRRAALSTQLGSKRLEDLGRRARRVEAARDDLVEQLLEAGVLGQAGLEVAAQAVGAERQHLAAQVAPAALGQRALLLDERAVRVELLDELRHAASPCSASVRTIGTRHAESPCEAPSESTLLISRTIVSVSGWSALLTTMMSGISMTPGLQRLDRVAGARHQHEHDRVGVIDDVDLGLADADGLEEDVLRGPPRPSAAPPGAPPR